MDLFFEALGYVLKEFLAGALACIVVMLAIVLVVSSMLYSVWLFSALFFLIVFGVAVSAKMEEIKRWRYK